LLVAAVAVLRTTPTAVAVAAVLVDTALQQDFQYQQELHTPSRLARAVLDEQIIPALLVATVQTPFLIA
jgi:hypothetical protein